MWLMGAAFSLASQIQRAMDAVEPGLTSDHGSRSRFLPGAWIGGGFLQIHYRSAQRRVIYR